MADPVGSPSAIEIKSRAREFGFDLVGVCDARPPSTLEVFRSWLAAGFSATMDYLPRSLPLRSDPSALLPGVRSIIAVGLNYNQTNEPAPGQPRIARYALGRDYHKVLRSKLKRLAEGIPGECRVCVDSAPILEREYANRAGLGWIGKNTCLINTERGSWFFLGLVLTTAELAFDAPAHGGCGTCTACIDACPTGAIVQVEGRWQIDSRRCISYLTIEHRGEIEPSLLDQVGDWTFGCDICQEVCPFNRPRDHQPLRARETSEPDFLARREWPGLVELAQISEPRWDELTRGSAVRRAGFEGLRRNAIHNRRGKLS